MTTTRRRFFGILFRSVATAAALAYAPSVLRCGVIPPGRWVYVGLFRKPTWTEADWEWRTDQEVRALKRNFRRVKWIRPSRVDVTYRREVEFVMDYEAEACSPN